MGAAVPRFYVRYGDPHQVVRPDQQVLHPLSDLPSPAERSVNASCVKVEKTQTAFHDLSGTIPGSWLLAELSQLSVPIDI